MKRIVSKKEQSLAVDLGKDEAGNERGKRTVKFFPTIFKLENEQEMVESAGSMAAVLDFVNNKLAGAVKTKQRNFITAFVKKAENADKSDAEVVEALTAELDKGVSLKDFIRSAEGVAARAKKLDEVANLVKQYEGQGAIPMDKLAEILASM